MIWQKVTRVCEETVVCFFKGAADGDIIYNPSLLCASDRPLLLARQYVISSIYSFQENREEVSNLQTFTITGKCFSNFLLASGIYLLDSRAEGVASSVQAS
jgi:hypothetical protein